MTPEQLAGLHPRLYHLTSPDAWPRIQMRGLLTPAQLVRLFELDEDRCRLLTTQRRAADVRLDHPVHRSATLSDNRPLSEARLTTCLDDGLTAPEWLGMLNDRVFFWTDLAGVERLRSARVNRERPRAVLMFDTLRLAQAHGGRMEISPINSGATVHQPARRGRGTFAPLLDEDYQQWRRRRGQRDRIKEVTIRGGVPDIGSYFEGFALSPD